MRSLEFHNSFWDLQLCQLFRFILVSFPFGQIIRQVQAAITVENVAGRSECRWHHRRRSEIKKGGKREPHIAPFIGNMRTTNPAAHLAGQDTLRYMAFTIVEADMSQPLQNADEIFLENSRPLHRRAVQLLAHLAVANLGV